MLNSSIVISPLVLFCFQGRLIKQFGELITFFLPIQEPPRSGPLCDFTENSLHRLQRSLCERKNVTIEEGELCPDHIHMLVSIPPSMSVSQFMGYLKGKSSLIIFDRHANLKYKYGNRRFWCRGYYVDTVGRNRKVIAEYIRNQLVEDMAADKLVQGELFDPFTGIPKKH